MVSSRRSESRASKSFRGMGPSPKRKNNGPHRLSNVTPIFIHLKTLSENLTISSSDPVPAISCPKSGSLAHASGFPCQTEWSSHLLLLPPPVQPLRVRAAALLLFDLCVQLEAVSKSQCAVSRWRASVFVIQDNGQFSSAVGHAPSSTAHSRVS